MTLEAGVVVGSEGQAIYWHLPVDRSTGHLPDSRKLWEVIWENRASIQGFAHSHPGGGHPGPSWEDLTTFAGVELGIGRRLIWWIASSNSLSIVLWAGPGEYDYEVFPAPSSRPKWLERLRRNSNYGGNENGSI